ncbi:hypothetical protein GLAREA_08716 [Glarea lozoyensis ATCC 20868]|uniref:Uncharacterized protein n=1 Tax=Glarea lozoyensis (strain ATCC 20868 / MF5171) TaxID=1116229 RepID=S3EE58_GLAL2|nr:uncharacterized protein GLAREA_08716 [Glarea lozoyensis ATCC 20868]EPE36553.1 hypothetical protein GLAREA_08716 [Glarea lozoyensis ATCC 20868]
MAEVLGSVGEILKVVELAWKVYRTCLEAQGKDSQLVIRHSDLSSLESDLQKFKTRLLVLSSYLSSPFREQPSSQYSALSYCWGNNEHEATTERYRSRWDMAGKHVVSYQICPLLTKEIWNPPDLERHTRQLEKASIWIESSFCNQQPSVHQWRTKPPTGFFVGAYSNDPASRKKRLCAGYADSSLGSEYGTQARETLDSHVPKCFQSDISLYVIEDGCDTTDIILGRSSVEEYYLIPAKAMHNCCSSITWAMKRLFSLCLRSSHTGGSRNFGDNRFRKMIFAGLLCLQPVSAVAIDGERMNRLVAEDYLLKPANSLGDLEDLTTNLATAFQNPDIVLAASFAATTAVVAMYTRNGDDAKQKHYLLSGLMFGLIAGSFFASNAMTFVFVWIFGGIICALSGRMTYRSCVLMKEIRDLDRDVKN